MATHSNLQGYLHEVLVSKIRKPNERGSSIREGHYVPASVFGGPLERLPFLLPLAVCVLPDGAQHERLRDWRRGRHEGPIIHLTLQNIQAIRTQFHASVFLQEIQVHPGLWKSHAKMPGGVNGSGCHKVDPLRKADGLHIWGVVTLLKRPGSKVAKKNNRVIWLR